MLKLSSPQLFGLSHLILKKKLWGNKKGIRNLRIPCEYSERKLIEHIYGFLMIVERILQKYADKKSEDKNEADCEVSF